jgi:predicted AlkP superfamily pyrophosphatase or phosphodiesterase
VVYRPAQGWRLDGSSRQKVLVIGVDGLRWDRVLAADAPHLTELAAAGRLAVHELDEAGYAARTLSGPGWSSIATGVWPGEHGVRDNTFTGARFAEFPDFLTVMKRRRPKLATFAALSWPPLARHGTLGAEVDLLLTDDGETYGYRDADARLATLAADLLLGHNPDAAFVYLGWVDIAGHAFGAASPEYLDAIAAVDGWVGYLLEAVEARPSYEDESWLVVVVTDHGHTDAGGHGGFTDGERQTAMITANLNGYATANTDGRLVDVAPTVLAHIGLSSEVVPG